MLNPFSCLSNIPPLLLTLYFDSLPAVHRDDEKFRFLHSWGVTCTFNQHPEILCRGWKPRPTWCSHPVWPEPRSNGTCLEDQNPAISCETDSLVSVLWELSPGHHGGNREWSGAMALPSVQAHPCQLSTWKMLRLQGRILPASSSFWWHSLAWGHIPPSSASVSTGPSSLCVYVSTWLSSVCLCLLSSYKDTSHWI